MQEDFLHFVWRLKRFRLKNLTTTTGEPINIIDFGTHNHHSGPDFLNARLRIGDTLWAGNVEMHLRASEWLTHQHQTDPAYENVILHVVLDEDVIIRRQDGERILCLNLRPYLPAGLAKQYLRLLHNENWIPCQHQLYTVPTVTRSLWLDRMLVERLEERTAIMAVRLQQNNGDWEETFYQSLAWGFGLKVNADPYLMLAESLPLKTLLKHKNNLLQLEALIFGQAGMLETKFQDKYPQQLQHEYTFLRKKYKLKPISNTLWKYMRMRPANFPTVRLAQFATLIYRTGHLFSKMLAAKNFKEIENAYVVKLSDYWQTHFRFDKESIKTTKSLGTSRVHLLIINIIAPFLFLYGQQKNDQNFKNRALQLLEAIPAERNAIIAQWNELGLNAEQAAQSQALLQLKKHYCDQKRCLNCAIGCNILKRTPMVMEEEISYLPNWWMAVAKSS